MKKANILLVIALAATCLNMHGVIVRNVKYTSTPTGIIRIDSIDYRKDLTRVYCKVIGRPHTSMRFNAISGAKDIDGIDLKRWFQFEDSGVIPIEIDFKSYHSTSPFSFDITTARNTIKVDVNKKK